MTREERNEYARKRYHSPVGQAYVKKRKESIPLQHPLVCGLHVDYNMQVIPWIENRRKGNRINLNTKV
jgi:hypothetical protein